MTESDFRPDQQNGQANHQLKQRFHQIGTILVGLQHYLDMPAGAIANWATGLKEGLSSPQEHGEAHNRFLRVVQFADGVIDKSLLPGEAKKSQAFFKAFGITTDSGEGLDLATIRDYVKSGAFPRISEEELEANGLPESDFILTQHDRDSALVLGTNIDGVRMEIEGEAIVNTELHRVRPMLLVEAGE